VGLIRLIGQLLGETFNNGPNSGPRPPAAAPHDHPETDIVNSGGKGLEGTVIALQGRPLEQVTDRAQLVARIIGSFLGLTPEQIAQVMAQTTIRLYFSSAPSNAGGGAIHITATQDIRDPESARTLMLTLASEMGHRMHQVLLGEDAVSERLVASGVAEAFEFVARLFIAFAIDHSTGQEELLNLRQRGRDGGLLIQALERLNIKIEKFEGGTSAASKEVLKVIAALVMKRRPHITATSLQALLYRIAIDFFSVPWVGRELVARPGYHLQGAWLARRLISDLSKGSWLVAARCLGRTLADGAVPFKTVKGFRTFLEKISQQTEEAGPQHDVSDAVRRVSELVHEAASNPIIIPPPKTILLQTDMVREKLFKAAQEMASDVTLLYFPNHVMEAEVIEIFSTIDIQMVPVQADSALGRRARRRAA
jgi:hypothetical protein